MKHIEKKENKVKIEDLKKIVPDTSILIHGDLSVLASQGKLDGKEIIIPKTVIDELQAQASRAREIGFKGLDEIKKIREAAKEHGITVRFTGQRPTMEEIQLAKKGRIDALIRDAAEKENATLLTADYVQALVGEAEGVSVSYIRQNIKTEGLMIEGFFDKDTQSVHLKEGVVPMAKKGRPGSIELVKLRDKPVTTEEIEQVMDEIMSKVRIDPASFVEIGKMGATVVQMGNYRIAITRPPFSDGIEVTAVRPTTKLSLAQYELHGKVQEMLVSGSRGVLIAGPPGSGKSTFAASIADYLVSKGKVVKTFEQPRDLQVGDEVTQYAPLEGDWEKTSELLLLVRPDYTIFDEVRRTHDFRIFGDMRLAGVGMIGVVHSTDPISAIQRFIGKVELGMIPHIIDMVLYVQAGKVAKTFAVGMTVKVPSGMTEADLTRPVVEIRDFVTNKLEYEIYTYGEENVIVPVSEKESGKESPLRELAKDVIQAELRIYDRNARVEFKDDRNISVFVDNEAIPRLIGKGGSNIELLQKRLGLHISVEPKEATLKKHLSFSHRESGGAIELVVDRHKEGVQVDVNDGDQYLFSAHVGKKGSIRIRKKSEVGHRTLAAIARGTLKVYA
jgi:ATPase